MYYSRAYNLQYVKLYNHNKLYNRFLKTSTLTKNNTPTRSQSNNNKFVAQIIKRGTSQKRIYPSMMIVAESFIHSPPVAHAYNPEFSYMASNANFDTIIFFVVYNFVAWMLPVMVIGRLLQIEWNTISFHLFVFGVIRVISLHLS